MADRNRFEILEESVESTIDHCREAGIIVCDYQPSIVFQRKINELVTKLQDVERIQTDMNDVNVPVEVFNKIDAGQNPQLYTRECMERALARNEAVRGKLESLRRFRALLMAELSHYFPNEVAKYRTVRGDPEAPGSGGGGNPSAVAAGTGAPVGVGSTAQSVSGMAQSHGGVTSQANGSGTDTGPESYPNR